MSKTVTGLTAKSALTRERRTNRRLRALIDNLHTDIRSLRLICEMNLTRLGQVQAEVDQLKTLKSVRARRVP